VEFNGYDFVDDFDPLNLFDTLTSDEYDAPPDDLAGLIAAQNNILAGFVGNKLYLTEPAVPHAWPQQYAVTFEHNIVGLAPINGSILVLTEGYPYFVSGSDPAAGMDVRRIDTMYPCLNRKGIVAMNYGVVYPTHDGMAVFSPASGPTIITRVNFNNDTWAQQLDPTTIIGEFYGDAYLASHSSGGFAFEPDKTIGGQFVTLDFSYTASWYDPVGGKLYCVVSGGDVYEWDSLSQPAQVQEWKSKVIKTSDMINLGAARVIADYGSPTAVWEEDEKEWQSESMVWNALENIEFELWVDKELLFSTHLDDMGVFRLPTGYRSDTFEVGVTGDVRVRAIHLGETPLSLKEA